MKKLKLFATVLAASATLMICGCTNHNAIVTVNGDAITKAQYEKAFDAVADNSMFAQMGIDLKKDPNSFLHLMIKDRVVNELVVKKLLDQEIKRRHIKVSKADMDAQLKSIIDKVGSKEKFNELLKQNGVSSAQFKKDLTDEVKIQKLVDTLAVVTVSDKDAMKFYKDNQDKFKNPDKVRASHILVSSNPEELKAKIASSAQGKSMTEDQLKAEVDKQMAAQKAKAEKLLAEVKKDTKSFAKVAKENSDDTQSAKQGGDLGFFGKEEMVEPFSKAAFSMKPNTLSGVVQTPYGYHIILVTDRVKAGIEPFDNVKAEIKDFLTNQEKVKTLQQFVDTLKNNAKIEYNDPSFNPAEIQKALKEQSKNNPALMEGPKSAKE